MNTITLTFRRLEIGERVEMNDLFRTSSNQFRTTLEEGSLMTEGKLGYYYRLINPSTLQYEDLQRESNEFERKFEPDL